jgi:hypothetical protein
VHNTYFTLPVLFAMLSNHYSFLWSHKYNWVVLVLMMLGGAAIRQFFVLRHGWKLGRNRNPLPYALVGRGRHRGHHRVAEARRRGHRVPRRAKRPRATPGAEGARAALLHVPRRAGADEERARRLARAGEAARRRRSTSRPWSPRSCR